MPWACWRHLDPSSVFDGVEYQVDCIIYASGFEVASPPDCTAGFDMRGAGGITLSDYWAGEAARSRRAR